MNRDRVKLKEKTFTEGAENGLEEVKKEKEFNPLKL